MKKQQAKITKNGKREITLIERNTMQPNTPKGKQKKVKKESESKKKRRLIPFSIRRKSKLKETEVTKELEISALDEISAKTLMEK